MLETISPPTDRPCRFGAHMQTTGGLHTAFQTGSEYECEVVQIFTSSPQQWRVPALTEEMRELFYSSCRDTGIPCVAAHANYLINPASPDPVIQARSRKGLLQEVERCIALCLPSLVMHPGCAVGATEEEALARVIETVRLGLDAMPPEGLHLLLETTAGQGTSVGHRFEQLAAVLDAVDDSRLGVCLDTCHIFAAGYDFRTPETYHPVMSRFDELIGLHRLRLIHANDSLKDLGSRVDRHAHIGKGLIGEPGFRHLLTDPRLAHIPVVIETPKDDEMDRVNLAALRRLAAPE